MSEGNWRVGVYLDDVASDSQAERLGAVLSGQAGGPPAMLGPLIGEMLAYGLAWLAGWLTGKHPGAAHILAVATFAACGVYQLSRLKDRCLAHCRSPLGLLLHYGSYRGKLRDLRAGVHHGAYCLGCCWGLMVILVAVGVMNPSHRRDLVSLAHPRPARRARAHDDELTCGTPGAGRGGLALGGWGCFGLPQWRPVPRVLTGI